MDLSTNLFARIRLSRLAKSITPKSDFTGRNRVRTSPPLLRNSVLAPCVLRPEAPRHHRVQNRPRLIAVDGITANRPCSSVTAMWPDQHRPLGLRAHNQERYRLRCCRARCRSAAEPNWGLEPSRLRRTHAPRRIRAASSGLACCSDTSTP